MGDYQLDERIIIHHTGGRSVFGRKSKKQKTYITIYSEQENKAQDYLRGEIPIKEEAIIKKSLDFFDDPEPCYIHRGAVIMRLNEEIMETLGDYKEQEKVEASLLPAEVIGYIDLPKISFLSRQNK